MRPDLDLGAARTFMTVIEAHGLSSAARRLGLAKSVVSARIGALERQLGVTLFTRGARLIPTKRGFAFYDGLRATLGDLDQLVRNVSGSTDELGGKLRLTMPSGLGVAYLGGLLCRFLAVHNAIEAEVDFSDRYADITGESYDLALRIGQPSDSDLIGRRLCRMRRIICASPAYLAEHGRPTSVVELSRHRAIGYALVQGSGQWLFQEAGSGKLRAADPPRLTFLANSGEAMREAARAGLGIALLPSFFVVDDIATGDLIQLTLDLPPLGLELWALHARRRERRPIVTAFVEWLGKEVGDPPFWESDLNEPR